MESRRDIFHTWQVSPPTTFMTVSNCTPLPLTTRSMAHREQAEKTLEQRKHGEGVIKKREKNASSKDGET